MGVINKLLANADEYLTGTTGGVGGPRLKPNGHSWPIRCSLSVIHGYSMANHVKMCREADRRSLKFEDVLDGRLLLR